MEEFKAEFDSIRSGKLSLAELETWLKTGGMIHRAHVIWQIPKQFSSAESVAVLAAAAENPDNKSELGGRSIQVLAISSLIAMGRGDAIAAAKRIIDTLSESDIDDLEWHLKGENLQMP